MQKTKIEWVKNPDSSQGYTLNPIKGKCPVACHYCYARRMYDRFKWNPKPRLDEPTMFAPLPTKPSSIFLCSTFEWLWNKEWATRITKLYDSNPQHRFYTLTKYPERIWTFSPFPNNVWVGVTVDEGWQLAKTLDLLNQVKAPKKFISFEPLQEEIDDVDFLQDGDIDWVIIGARTQPFDPPPVELVKDIVKYADKGNTKVFLKNNLFPIFKDKPPYEYPWAFDEQLIENQTTGEQETYWFLRQEMPQ